MTDTAEAPERGHRWFAATYDIITKPGEKKLGRLRARLLEGLHGDVLEIGAGTGANFERYPAGVRVVALEPDPHMLKRAQARLAELGRTDIDVRLAAAESLPFEAASFDAVVSTLVLCTVADPPRALAEMRRVLRPGGELRFIEHVRAEGALGRVQDVMQPVWGWCSAGCQLNRRTEDALRAAGFDIDAIDHKKMAPWMPAIVGSASAASPPPDSVTDRPPALR
jgi:ubiquinone/menaquinone biosynthesis C-methylase UbiE